MPRRKAPAKPDALLNQILAGVDAKTALESGERIDDLKKALAERALNTEMDRHLAGEGKVGPYASPDLISAVTDAVLDEVATWQARPLEPVYLIVFFDALRVKIRDEGSVSNRFVEDMLMAVVDALKRLRPLPDAVTGVFSETTVQACVVHLLRHNLDLVGDKNRKSVAAALTTAYRAVDVEAGEKALTAFDAGFWGQKHPAIGQSWRRGWPEEIPFYAFPDEVRRIIYTTNAIEALNPKLRRAARARVRFSSDQDADFASLRWTSSIEDIANAPFNPLNDRVPPETGPDGRA